MHLGGGQAHAFSLARTGAQAHASSPYLGGDQSHASPPAAGDGQASASPLDQGHTHAITGSLWCISGRDKAHVSLQAGCHAHASIGLSLRASCFLYIQERVIAPPPLEERPCTRLYCEPVPVAACLLLVELPGGFMPPLPLPHPC